MQVIKPSALNVIIVGLSMILFVFVWRTMSAWLSARDGVLESVGEGMAVLL